MVVPLLFGLEARIPYGLARALRGVDDAVGRFGDTLAETDARRRFSALLLSVGVNAIALTLLGVFGKVTIFVPNRPAESISVVMVNLPDDPLPELLQDPEVAEEPEPEPETAPEPEPEIVEPEPEPEPAPDPTPEPEEAPPEEPEPEPEPESEPEPEPEPVIALPEEPDFTQSAGDEPAPFIPDPIDARDPFEASEAETLEPAPPAPLEDEALDEEQTPAEDAPPLIEVEPSPRPTFADEGDPGEDIGDEVASDETDEDDEGELVAGEDGRSVAEAEPEPSDLAGDDQFDQAPVFSRRRFIAPRVQLPTAPLPEGETSSTLPGESGVVAIFCPEEFRNNPEKAEECAGRPEIRSGWRPGGGENFDEAVRLLRKDRERGYAGDRSNQQFGPEIARRLEREDEERALRDAARSVGGVNDLGTNAANANDPAQTDRPNIGPEPFEPSWTLRDDETLTTRELEELRKDLERADAERRGEEPDDD